MSAVSNYLSLYIGTNYVPYVSKEAVRELFQEPEQRIQRLEQEIHEVTLALQAATQKRDAFVAANAASVLKRPFDALSDETLSEIFLSSLPGPSERYPSLYARSAPLIFGHVCRRWRRVAFERTPRLWSSICISLPPAISQSIEFGQVGVPRSYVRYTYEFGFTKEASVELHRSVSAQCALISQWLTRSASLPLSIFIRTTETNPVVSAYLQPYLDTLLEFSKRWETLKVIIPSGNLLDTLCTVPSSEVPRLKNLMLRLSYQRCRNLQSDAWCSSGLVRAPTLQRLSMDLPYLTDDTAFLPLNSITHLSFNPNPNGSRNGSSPTRFTVPAAKGLLLGAPNIVDLTLELCEPRPVPKMFTPSFAQPTPWPTSSFPPVSQPQHSVTVVASAMPYIVPPTVHPGIPWLQTTHPPSVPPGAALVAQSTPSTDASAVASPAQTVSSSKTEATGAIPLSSPSSPPIVPGPVPGPSSGIPQITITPPSTESLPAIEDGDITVLVRPATPPPSPPASTQPPAAVPTTNGSIVGVPTPMAPTPPTPTSTSQFVGLTLPPLPSPPPLPPLPSFPLLPQLPAQSWINPLPSSLSHLHLPTQIQPSTTSPSTGFVPPSQPPLMNSPVSLQIGPTYINNPQIPSTFPNSTVWPPVNPTINQSPQPIDFDQLALAHLFDSDPGRKWSSPDSPMSTFPGPLNMSELAKIPRIDLVHLETLEITDVALDAEELFATLHVPNLKHLVYYGMNRQVGDGSFRCVPSVSPVPAVSNRFDVRAKGRLAGSRRRRRAAFLTLLDPRDGPVAYFDDAGEAGSAGADGMGLLPEPVLYDDTVPATFSGDALFLPPPDSLYPIPPFEDSSTYIFTAPLPPLPPRRTPTPPPPETHVRIQAQLEHLPPRCNLTSLTLDLYTLQLSDVLECIQLTPELTHFTHRHTAPISYSALMPDTPLDFVDWEPAGRHMEAPVVRREHDPLSPLQSAPGPNATRQSMNEGIREDAKAKTRTKRPGVLLIGKANPGVVYYSGFNVGLSVPVSVMDAFVRILTPEGVPWGDGGVVEDEEVGSGARCPSEKLGDEVDEDAEGDPEDDEMLKDDEDDETGAPSARDDRMDTDDDESGRRWTWKEKGKEKELPTCSGDANGFSLHSPSDTTTSPTLIPPPPTIPWPKLTHLNIFHPIHLSDSTLLEFLQQRRRWAKATPTDHSDRDPNEPSSPVPPRVTPLERVKVDISHPTPFSPTPLVPSAPCSPASSFSSSSSSFYSPPLTALPYPAITGPWPESTNPAIKAGLKRCVERMEGFVLELRYLPPVYDFSRSFEAQRGLRKKGVVIGTR